MGKLDIRNLDAPFGAEVRGFDPGMAADEESSSLLQAAFDDRGLLLFRDLDVTFAEQQALVDALVGAEDSLATMPDGFVEEATYISNRRGERSAFGRLNFHSDAMWSENPFSLVSLYALDVASDAPPTSFASTDAAWRTLPADLRARVEGLHVVQGEGPPQLYDDKDGERFATVAEQQDRSRVTPLALRHPRTDRILLFVSEQQTRDVVELGEEESRELLDALFAHLYRPDNTIEHTWSDGDFAAWDNLGVQHARPHLHLDGSTRILRRTVVPPSWIWKLQFAQR
jgi:alpha-ketoglutarate-dependent taurine dioxygenase